MESTVTPVSAHLDTLERIVKQIYMSVLRIRVKMEVRVQTESMVTIAFVRLDTLVLTAKQILTSVYPIPVKMEQHALTV